MIVPCVGTPEYRAWRRAAAKAPAHVVTADGEPRRLIFREVPKAVPVEDIIAAYRKSFDTELPAEFFEPREKRTTIVQIVEEVCAKHGITRTALLSKRRHRDLVLARHEAMWRAREETTLSFPQIGAALQRDHSSCIWGARKHEASRGQRCRFSGFLIA